MSNLLPCPFCGGEATLDAVPTGIMGRVYCRNDDCFGPRTTAQLKCAAIAQWNKRPALQGSVVVPVGTAVNYDDILSRISVWRDHQPEEDESWESWYFAAFDLLRYEVVEMQKAMTLPRQADQLRARQWQPFATAPKDGTQILAVVAPNRGGHLEHHAGRAFVIRHEGKTASDYDLGWAVYPGFGGASDHDFSHWQPLPTLALTPQERP